MNKEEKLLEEKFPERSIFELSHQTEAELLNKVRNEWLDIRKIIKKIERTNFENLYLLLEQFYHTHHASYDCLIFPFINDYKGVRIQNMGGELQQIRSEKERKTKLREYQNEMESFANFIKTNFLKDDS